jgi:hypothetical protein
LALLSGRGGQTRDGQKVLAQADGQLVVFLDPLDDLVGDRGVDEHDDRHGENDRGEPYGAEPIAP